MTAGIGIINIVVEELTPFSHEKGYEIIKLLNMAVPCTAENVKFQSRYNCTFHFR